jgi:hypothetical protein
LLSIHLLAKVATLWINHLLAKVATALPLAFRSLGRASLSS